MMLRSMFARLVATSLVLGPGVNSELRAQLITLGPGTTAYALSGDGSTVVGTRASGFFRWNAAGGVQPLPLAAGSLIQNVSQDGTVVFGRNPAPNTAFRYDGQTTTFYPGVIAQAISRDGLVMTGQVQPGFHAVRWTVSEPTPVRLSLSTTTQIVASAINADGSVIVGDQNGASGNFGMRWTAAGGVVPFGPGSPYSFAMATDVSPDGSIVIGNGSNATGAAGFRRDASGTIEVLPHIPGQVYAGVRGMSADGQTLIGASGVPAVWMGSSVVSLDDFLTLHGVSSAGWIFFAIADISDDGRVLTGTGLFNGQEQAWVAVVPAPGAGVFVLAAMGARRRRGSLRSRATRGSRGSRAGRSL
ncbi:MAG: hypothetical protein ACKVW3_15875 [Phycisphaerales bacterium]